MNKNITTANIKLEIMQNILSNFQKDFDNRIPIRVLNQIKNVEKNKSLFRHPEDFFYQYLRKLKIKKIGKSNNTLVTSLFMKTDTRLMERVINFVLSEDITENKLFKQATPEMIILLNKWVKEDGAKIINDPKWFNEIAKIVLETKKEMDKDNNTSIDYKKAWVDIFLDLTRQTRVLKKVDEINFELTNEIQQEILEAYLINKDHIGLTKNDLINIENHSSALWFIEENDQLILTPNYFNFLDFLNKLEKEEKYYNVVLEMKNYSFMQIQEYNTYRENNDSVVNIEKFKTYISSRNLKQYISHDNNKFSINKQQLDVFEAEAFLKNVLVKNLQKEKTIFEEVNLSKENDDFDKYVIKWAFNNELSLEKQKEYECEIQNFLTEQCLMVEDNCEFASFGQERKRVVEQEIRSMFLNLKLKDIENSKPKRKI